MEPPAEASLLGGGSPDDLSPHVLAVDRRERVVSQDAILRRQRRDRSGRPRGEDGVVPDAEAKNDVEIRGRAVQKVRLAHRVADRFPTPRFDLLQSELGLVNAARLAADRLNVEVAAQDLIYGARLGREADAVGQTDLATVEFLGEADDLL